MMGSHAVPVEMFVLFNFIVPPRFGASHFATNRAARRNWTFPGGTP